MKREKLDGMDSERIRNTIDSSGWQLIQQRIAKERDKRLSDLIRPSGEVETARLRGCIEGLTTALKIPEILMQEGEENSK